MSFRDKNYWALILGGSSGFGLATAKKLSQQGMNICVVHRDRKGSMQEIEKHFEMIRSQKVGFLSYNKNALEAHDQDHVLESFQQEIGGGKVRVLLHSIAFGNLKLLAPLKPNEESVSACQKMADSLGVSPEKIREAANKLFDGGVDSMYTLADFPKYSENLFLEEEDFVNTIYAMGTSMLTWVRKLFSKKMFADDSRVLGMTSEGNEVAWYGYAAVSVAKAALEAASRAVAKEFAPHGIRSNIVQAGVTLTPALSLIPGSKHLSSKAKLSHPFGRLTTVEDVANFIYLLCLDEASWVNGALVRVDGGERISK